MKRLLFVLAVCAGSLAAQTAALLPWQPTQFLDNSGRVLAGGKVCTYVAGTSTGLATYTDSTGATPNPVPPNAIVLDSSGRANIWLAQDRAYKISLFTAGTDGTCSTGTLVRSVDQMTAGMAARYTATAAPTTGTWQTGDFVWNSTPSQSVGSASAVLGWVCVSGGAPGTWVAAGPVPVGNLPAAAVTGAFTPYTTANFIATETGSANAIAGALQDLGGNNVTLAAGLCVTVKLAHTLQAGANTFALNGTVKNIKSHFNSANNIGTAYAATGYWSGCYDATEWLDASE
jgi:hypothetical protein